MGMWESKDEMEMNLEIDTTLSSYESFQLLALFELYVSSLFMLKEWRCETVMKVG
jgi:hypothetical protein